MQNSYSPLQAYCVDGNQTENYYLIFRLYFTMKLILNAQQVTMFLKILPEAFCRVKLKANRQTYELLYTKFIN